MLTFTLSTCILVYETGLLQPSEGWSFVISHSKARCRLASVIDG